jgi:prepilin-type N-terminal cleavage/methylation domain-containing protein/prepilin-type processing-associated H-X9-DG protein
VLRFTTAFGQNAHIVIESFPSHPSFRGASGTLRSRAFTLVELLTVLAIVAVLTAVLIPAVGKVLHNARRTQSGANLRQIAIAYATYSSENGQPCTLVATTVYDWALALARDGGINEANLYYFEDDPLVAASTAARPKSVAFNDGKGTWTINPDFDGFPLSVTVVSGIAPDANPSTTPIAWTRGLQTDGTWSGPAAATPGAWNGEGGFIAFLDGHVEWYRTLTDDNGNGVLVNYITKRPTANYTEAINATATVLASK